MKEEQILANLDRFYDLIKTYITTEGRGDKLINFYKSRELVLCTAPASSRLAYHNCFAGGYLDHIIRVTEAALVLDKVWDRFQQKRNHTTEELVFCAINHDLGKLGTDDTPMYIPNTSEWHVKNQGKLYNTNPSVNSMRVSDRSIFELQKAGISISETEYIAILTHDGLYEESNKYYLMPHNPESQLKTNLPYILHQADLLASKVENQIER